VAYPADLGCNTGFVAVFRTLHETATAEKDILVMLLFWLLAASLDCQRDVTNDMTLTFLEIIACGV
jgi:hypothetical protein